MITVLEALIRARARHRCRDLDAQRDAVLKALAGGRMLSRKQLRKRMGLALRSVDLSRVLQRLELRGHIVVDREERPLLYGRLP